MYNFVSQKDALEQFKQIKSRNLHSIIISGAIGVGKTYLARCYAQMLNITNFIVIKPTVENIRTMVEECYSYSLPTVVCIENLDTGVVSASHTLLKILEEPPSNLYLIVTCRNLQNILDTIISRCASVKVNNPSISDIELYARDKDSDKYLKYHNQKIWNAVDSLGAVDILYKFSQMQCEYFNQLFILFNSIKSDTISNLLWNIGHFPNNTEIPIHFMLNYLLHNTEDDNIRYSILYCMKDIDNAKIAPHVCIAKMLFDVKFVLAK